ncbi:MAG: pyridoxal phosphate-dependent decarboxylase family protein [Gemmatimonadota bacterium]
MVGRRRTTGDWEAAFRESARRVADWVADYRENARRYPVLATVRPGEVAGRLAAGPPEDPEPLEAILEDLDRVLLPGITHWNHPGFLAYFSSSSSAPALLAEFVIAALGVNAMLWHTSPAATELEERMVDWLRRSVGLPREYGGVILDTASTSSFTAILAARERTGLEVRARGLAGRPELPRLTLYVSEQAHSSLEKGAIAAGLGRAAVRRIPVDAGFRMRVECLERRIAADREAGCRPIFVGATLGTTSTASVDPVAEIAEVCARQRVWLHVDAAYAGPAAILPELRHRFTGWEKADSLVINPHKWMGVPMDCSVLLFRSPEAFRAPLALTPAYLSAGETGVTNLMDYGLPLGRRFRALKLWFLFRGYGLAGLRRLLRRHIELAEEFAGRLGADDRWTLPAPPSFSTVCFRAVPPRGSPADPDELNARILRHVNRSGAVFLSHTVLRDRYTLRLSVGNVRTGLAEVSEAYRRLVAAYDAEREETAR